MLHFTISQLPLTSHERFLLLFASKLGINTILEYAISFITQYILFRYILEMRDVRLKLESVSYESYNVKIKNQRRLENLNVIVLTVVSLPIAILGYFDIDTNVELNTQINLAYMVLRPLSFIFSIIMFIIFVDLIRFF